MAFGGEMHDGANPVVPHDLKHGGAITNILLHKGVVRQARHGFRLAGLAA